MNLGASFQVSSRDERTEFFISHLNTYKIVKPERTNHRFLRFTSIFRSRKVDIQSSRLSLCVRHCSYIQPYTKLSTIHTCCTVSSRQLATFSFSDYCKYILIIKSYHKNYVIYNRTLLYNTYFTLYSKSTPKKLYKTGVRDMT